MATLSKRRLATNKVGKKLKLLHKKFFHICFSKIKTKERLQMMHQ
jgi:hypothetical protein